MFQIRFVLNFVLLLVLLLAGTTIAADSAPAAPGKGELIITCLNIPDIQRGAGLAVVLQLPSGKTCLYDTGSGYPDRASPDGWAGQFNAGRDLILPFLEKRGIKEIDTLFISHAHYDHFGGLLWLKDQIPIRRLIDSGYVFNAEAPAAYTGELRHYDQTRDEFKKRHAWAEAHTGDIISLGEQLTVEVIAPPKEFFTKAYPEVRAKTDPPAHYLVNANSLGLRITYGKVVFLLPGDIQDVDQARSLVPSVAAEKLKCDVLIAPGHGLHAAQEFADAARPAVTLCSVFPRYARGLAANRVFGKLGSKVYITGVHGWLQVTCDGIGYEVKVEHPDGKLPGAK